MAKPRRIPKPVKTRRKPPLVTIAGDGLSLCAEALARLHPATVILIPDSQCWFERQGGLPEGLEVINQPGVSRRALRLFAQEIRRTGQRAIVSATLVKRSALIEVCETFL